MTKGVDEQVEPRETSGRGRKASKSRDMLSALEGRVTKLEGSMGDSPVEPHQLNQIERTEPVTNWAAQNRLNTDPNQHFS
ncbi:hypothetical protein J1N35_001278 [Gossypium stocksii]|uniref:Uncharacterized protein n=1 Tax=Gossypium stocksii TaxID=47602 RepID=A0A9D4AJG6_9ROSI|nr:hypothetical protein J1N35_001278 [Gossypium stocksii]